MTIEQVEAIVSVLDRHKVDYVMIGGIAAELHGAKIARSLDLDVTPAASRANRERIAMALAELNSTLRVPGGMPDGVKSISRRLVKTGHDRNIQHRSPMSPYATNTEMPNTGPPSRTYRRLRRRA